LKKQIADWYDKVTDEVWRDVKIGRMDFDVKEGYFTIG